MNRFSRCLAILLVVLTLLSGIGTVGAVPNDSTSGSISDATSTDVDTGAETNETEGDDKSTSFSKFKYSDYLEEHKDVPNYSGEAIVWGATENLTAKSENVTTVTDADDTLPAEGRGGMTISTKEDSFVEWTVTVPETALYGLNVLYYNVKGKDSDIERAIFIDGENLFTEANAVIFPRTWTDVLDPDAAPLSDEDKAKGYATFLRDTHDNDIRNESGEVFTWTAIDTRDNSGLYEDPFKYYLTAGTHTIRIESRREPMYINTLKLYSADEYITYEQLKAQYEQKGYKNGNASAVRVQAENISLKSAATIYAEYDRSSSKMQPYSYDVIRLNQIASDKFSTPYQWVEWNFEVAEEGLYEIVTRFDQSTRDGAFCNRTLYVNGVVPCAEARHVRFNYDDSWQVSAVSTPAGERMKFYFHKGVNTVRFEVTLGEFADIVSRVDDIVYVLNNCYREILMITGSSPDTYRDYQFPKLIPETLEQMKESSVELKQIVKDIKELTKEKNSSFTSSFNTLALDIDAMTSKPSNIAKKLSNFKANLGTISTWILNATSQPVGYDWVQITPVESKMEKAENGFFKNLWHQICMFIASFYMDYDDVGRRDTGTQKETRDITVWVTTSLDQSQILRRLIDNTLTQNSDLKVDLKLVAAATVLPSIAAGRGPDVVLGVTNSDPLNYAIRNAVVDVSQFDNYEEVMSRFADCAVTPYTYTNPETKKTSVYGVPETFSFSLLFYRKDILSELQMQVPKTWQEVYDCIVKLNMNSMMFGVTSDINTYATLLYQKGGQFYERNEEGLVQSALDKPQGIQCFEQWTEFYTAYGSLVTFDFSNRFRTGEMPMGISNYTTYNQLSVFATEIKGLWGFSEMPGTPFVDENGKEGINNVTMAGGTASVILSTTKNAQAAWDFLDWWTSDDIQVAYGLEMESILGTAARYATANKAALERLPWSTEDFRVISNQWEKTDALPEYPGSYILGRYVNFAFLAVVEEDKDPGEELLDYVNMINEELDRKQKEFLNN